jgi:hypothetical protein
MVGERGQAEFNIDNSDMFKSYKILSIKNNLVRTCQPYTPVSESPLLSLDFKDDK